MGERKLKIKKSKLKIFYFVKMQEDNVKIKINPAKRDTYILHFNICILHLFLCLKSISSSFSARFANASTIGQVKTSAKLSAKLS